MKLRGAISGFGEVAAKAHLAGWRTRENVNLGVIHDPLAERRHEAIRLVKNVRVYDDLELMLDGEAPDFVDIASPPALHSSAARTALNAGAHVLVEKPLGLSLAEFDEVAAVARAKQRVLMCVHNWKFAPAYSLARAMVAEGRIGSVQSVSLERLRVEPAGKGGPGAAWRRSGASGGGILIDHGWHVFYLMQWLMGGASPRAVTATLFTNPEGVEETAEVQVTFGAGQSARANLSWRAGQRRTHATIVGTSGSLEIGSERLLLTEGQRPSEELLVHDIPDDSYHSAWFSGVAGEFEGAISEGPNSSIAQSNLVEARRALALIVAARVSAKNRGSQTDIIA
ncbi:MAG TPA: Gfo/Idh/MocA family oxidoreductase [Candidatus Binataceae bacterium]